MVASRPRTRTRLASCPSKGSPTSTLAQPPPKQLALFVPDGTLELPAITTLLDSQLRSAAPRRLSSMTLLARVFRIDISVCLRCAGSCPFDRGVEP